MDTTTKLALAFFIIKTWWFVKQNYSKLWHLIWLLSLSVASAIGDSQEVPSCSMESVRRWWKSLCESRYITEICSKSRQKPMRSLNFEARLYNQRHDNRKKTSPCPCPMLLVLAQLVFIHHYPLSTVTQSRPCYFFCDRTASEFPRFRTIMKYNLCK